MVQDSLLVVLVSVVMLVVLQSYKQPELLMVLHLMVLLTLLRQIGVLLEVFISKMLQLLIPVRRLV